MINDLIIDSSLGILLGLLINKIIDIYVSS